MDNRTVFLSYSNTRCYEAEIIKRLFEKNNCSMICDLDIKDSFLGFMEKIENCEYVILLLSSAYFESKYCIYEALLGEKFHKKIRVTELADPGVRSIEERQMKYEKLKNCVFNVAPETENTFKSEIDTFEKYNELVVKVLNMKTYYVTGEDKYGTFKKVFRSIFGKEAIDLSETEVAEVKNLNLHSLDCISEELRTEMYWFLMDIKRCSYFKTSFYAEDAFGEQRLKFKDYTLMNGHLGAMLKIYAVDYNGKNQIIDFYNVESVEPNRGCCSKEFLKYYIVIINEDLYQKYEKQMKLPVERRDRTLLWNMKKEDKKDIGLNCSLKMEML